MTDIQDRITANIADGTTAHAAADDAWDVLGDIRDELTLHSEQIAQSRQDFDPDTIEEIAAGVAFEVGRLVAMAERARRTP